MLQSFDLRIGINKLKIYYKEQNSNRKHKTHKSTQNPINYQSVAIALKRAGEMPENESSIWKIANSVENHFMESRMTAMEGGW